MDSIPHASPKATTLLLIQTRLCMSCIFIHHPDIYQAPPLVDVFTHARRAPSEVYKEDTAFVRSFLETKGFPIEIATR